MALEMEMKHKVTAPTLTQGLPWALPLSRSLPYPPPPSLLTQVDAAEVADLRAQQRALVLDKMSHDTAIAGLVQVRPYLMYLVTN